MKPGWYAAHAAATAASAGLPAGASKMARCEPGSGVSSTTSEGWVLMAQPLGAVKAAPPGVVRGLSAVRRSGAGLAGGGASATVGAAVGGGAADATGATGSGGAPHAATRREASTRLRGVRNLIAPAYRR